MCGCRLIDKGVCLDEERETGTGGRSNAGSGVRDSGCHSQTWGRSDAL